MIRQPLVAKGFGSGGGFRWRGLEMHRIEGFSDAVLAFAVTLLVVSLEVPHTFGELLETIAHVETRLSEVACAYPITPSTTGLRSTGTA